MGAPHSQMYYVDSDRPPPHPGRAVPHRTKRARTGGRPGLAGNGVHVWSPLVCVFTKVFSSFSFCRHFASREEQKKCLCPPNVHMLKPYSPRCWHLDWVLWGAMRVRGGQEAGPLWWLAHSRAPAQRCPGPLAFPGPHAFAVSHGAQVGSVFAQMVLWRICQHRAICWTHGGCSAQ